MKYRVLASIALLSVFSTSYAKDIYKSRDWKLADNSTSRDPHASCVAYTTVKKGKTRFYLEIVHAKNQVGRTEIQVRAEGTTPSSFTAVVDSNTTLSFVNPLSYGTSLRARPDFLTFSLAAVISTSFQLMVAATLVLSLNRMALTMLDRRWKKYVTTINHFLMTLLSKVSFATQIDSILKAFLLNSPMLLRPS